MSTVDLTLAELEYLANHMTKEECDRLVASLHVDTYKLNKNMETVEDTVPEDIGCLKLLAHWNSSPGEGRDTTHEKLALRLRQIDKHDLAQWLDSAVLRELSEELNKTASEFSDRPGSHVSPELEADQEDLEEEFIDDHSLWEFIQAIFIVFCIIAIKLYIVLTINRLVIFWRKIWREFHPTKDLTRKEANIFHKKPPQNT